MTNKAKGVPYVAAQKLRRVQDALAAADELIAGARKVTRTNPQLVEINLADARAEVADARRLTSEILGMPPPEE